MAHRLREGATWRSPLGPNSIVIEPVHRGDTSVVAWVAEPSDGPGVALSPQQARELADALIAAADAVDPAGATHGIGTGKACDNDGDDPEAGE